MASLSSTEAPLSEVSAGAGKKAAAGWAVGASARCHTQYGRHPGVADFPSFPHGVTVVYVFYTEDGGYLRICSCSEVTRCPRVE